MHQDNLASLLVEHANMRSWNVVRIRGKDRLYKVSAIFHVSHKKKQKLCKLNINFVFFNIPSSYFKHFKSRITCTYYVVVFLLYDAMDKVLTQFYLLTLFLLFDVILIFHCPFSSPSLSHTH